MYIRVDTPGLTRLARDMRRAGGRDLSNELARSLRTHIKPLVPVLRSAIRATSSKGLTRSRKSVEERPLGLREAEARGVQVKVSFSGRSPGVGLRIDPRLFPEGSKTVISYREGVRSRWRVRNWKSARRREDWHSQRAVPAFFPTIRPRVEPVRAAVARDVEAAVDRATGAGLL